MVENARVEEKQKAVNVSRKLTGVVPVLVVPMREGGAPDIDGIHRLVEFLVKAGVGGMWVLGSASEDINMSLAHRLEVVKAVAEANRGRVPLIAGSGCTALEDIFLYMDRIEDLALDGVHVLPYDQKMGESRLVHFFTTLAERAPFPVWIYHNPKRGRAITDDVIGALKAHPRIAGIKVGGYNMTELTGALLHRSRDFDVIGAGGGQMFQMLTLGADAHTTSEASAYPEPFVELHRMFLEGDLDGAREKQFELIRLSRSFPRTDNGEYAAEEKYMLALRGICEDHVNALYRQLNATEKSQMRTALQTYGFPWA